MYWWNHNYSYVDGTGRRQYTGEYLARTPWGEVEGAAVERDGPRQCRDLERINRWIGRHLVDMEKYKDLDRMLDRRKGI